MWKCCNVAFVGAPNTAEKMVCSRSRQVSVVCEARGGGVINWLKRKFGKPSATPEPAKEDATVPEEDAPVPAAETVPAPVSDSSRDTAFETAFNHFDLDGNGKIDREELEKAAEELGESPEQISALMEKFDLNSDGGIDLPEFKKMVGEIEENCGPTSDECFVLENPDTWGKLFSYDPNQWKKLSKTISERKW